MNHPFHKPTKITRSVAHALFCWGVVATLTSATVAEDLYVNAAAAPNGDGSTDKPYWRITDGIERARSDRQGGVGEAITIHVAPGIYTGSYSGARLKREPRLELLPILINMPNLALSGATVIQSDASDLPTGARPGTETVLTTDETVSSPNFTASLILVAPTTDGGSGDGVTVSGFILDPKATVNLSKVGAPDVQSIWLDRAANFEIRRNIIMRSGDGVRSRM